MYPIFLEKTRKTEINELFTNFSLDIMLENVAQFTELLDYKIKTPSFLKIPTYNEKMNLIKTSEVLIKKSEQIEQLKTNNSFKLNELSVNNIAIAV